MRSGGSSTASVSPTSTFKAEGIVDDEALGRLTIAEDASLREAMEAIDHGAVEIALVADSQGRLLGTLSDGDIRRALLSGATLTNAVGPYITTNPRTTPPSSSRVDVLEQMRAEALSQIPIVTGDGRLVGLHILHDLLGGRRLPNAAVIMAGGKGTRLGPLTQTVPKPMLRVAGRPILERLVLHLVGSGIRRIRISVNYLSHVIEDHFGDGRGFGAEIRYLRESPDRPQGTAGSLSLIEADDEAMARPLLLMNGDLVTDFSVSDLLESHEASGAVATIALGEYRHRIPYGVARLTGDRLAELVEKPIESWAVNAGIYVLDPSLLRRIPEAREYHVTELLGDCLRRGEPVNAWQLLSDWQDIGRPTEFERARGGL